MGTTVAKLGSGDRLLDGQHVTMRIARYLRRLRLARYKKAVASGYDAAASHYDDWVWQALWRKTEWPQLRSVLLAPRPPRQVLEIGIGTGAIARHILEEIPDVIRYVGIDVSRGMLAECENLHLGPRVVLINDDVISVDFGRLGGSFDFVLSCRMIGHLQTLGEMFAKVRQVLATDGQFVVTDIDPGHNYVATRLPTDDGRIEVPTFKHRPEDVIAAAEQAGLRLDRLYRTYEDEALANAGAEAPASLTGRTGPLFNLFVFRPGPAVSA